MTATPRLGAPQVADASTTPGTDCNEQCAYYDQGAGHFTFVDRDLSAPPGSPRTDASYLVKATGTGAWTGHDGDIAFMINGSWAFIDVKEGMTAWVEDENLLIGATSSTTWITLSSGAITTDNDTTLAGDSSTNVPTQHAVKTYVDGKVAGLSWKQAVRAATTTNGTLATAFANGQTIDGVTLATGDRILLKNQTTGSENGIYVVAASGAPARSTDADSGAELVNATCYVSEGTVNADTQWTCTNNATITVGTTALTFAQINTGSTSFASQSEVRAGSVSSKAIAPDTLQSSAAFQTLTDAAPTSWDMAAGYNAKWTLTASHTLSTPTNPKEGLTYTLLVIQDGTGSRVPTLPSAFDFGSAGAPTFSTGANKQDMISLICTDALTPKFRAVFNKAA